MLFSKSFIHLLVFKTWKTRNSELFGSCIIFLVPRKCSLILGKLDWLLWGDLTREMSTEFGVFVLRMTLGLW